MYTGQAAISLFFSNVDALTAPTADELETTARKAMVTLLDPNDPANSERITVLQNNVIWSAMDESGNVSAFHTIPFLSHLNVAEFGVISADWVSVAWWRDSMLKVAPVLSQVLMTLKGITGGDPTKDLAFESQHKKLSGVLGALARNTNDAFIGAWGPSVMFALSGRHGVTTMEVAWAGNDKHFGQSVN